VSDIGIHPVSGALGAEVTGVDLSKPLDDQVLGVLRRAWLEHLVLFFRDQALTPAQFLAFGRRFGQTIEYPFVKGLDEYPDIIPVVKLEHERINFGGVWHSDTAYLDVPPMASMLLAREVPPAGGDTLFAKTASPSVGGPTPAHSMRPRIPSSACTPRPDAGRSTSTSPIPCASRA
jgi:taurine dioxygenase